MSDEKLLDFAPTLSIAKSLLIRDIQSIHLGKPGGKRSITFHLLKPGDVCGLWEPYLLEIQDYLLSTMPDATAMGYMTLRENKISKIVPARFIEGSDSGSMLLRGNEVMFSQFITGLSSLLTWQLLYKELEDPKFKVRCDKRSMVESTKPVTAMFASLFKLCRQVYPGEYAEHYRDYLHWFACCWHEEFLDSRSIAAPHPGKRADVLELRDLTSSYRDGENPHDEQKEKHHYRLFKTALAQPQFSESMNVFKAYKRELSSFTVKIENQPYVWTFGSNGFSPIQGRGRPRQ